MNKYPEPVCFGLESRLLRWLVAGFILSSSFSGRAVQTDSDGNKLPIGVLTNLARGISLEDLAAKTGIKLQHQFTARLESNDWSCVKLSFERPKGYFYFLFRNGGLVAIQERAWQVEFETNTYQGVTRQIPKPLDSEIKMTKIIEGPDLSSHEIIEKLQEWVRNEMATAKGQEPMNILPAFIITAPLLVPKQIRAEREAEKLVEQFDAFKIKLGAATNEVQSLFGDPARRIKMSSNRWVHVYGSKLSPHTPVKIPPVWISVLFSEGKVIRVFSRDFFDKRLVEVL